MKHDEIVNGEAASMPRSTLGMMPLAVFMQQDKERRAFNAYRVAFRRNEAEPNLRNAAALVRAWNGFADVMGLERR